jgi:hypothetical protein
MRRYRRYPPAVSFSLADACFIATVVILLWAKLDGWG